MIADDSVSNKLDPEMHVTAEFIVIPLVALIYTSVSLTFKLTPDIVMSGDENAELVVEFEISVGV